MNKVFDGNKSSKLVVNHFCFLISQLKEADFPYYI